MARIRQGSDDHTLRGVPEPSSNLLEDGGGVSALAFSQHPGFLPFFAVLLLALGNDSAAQFWESLPDSASPVPQLGRDFIY